MIEPEPPPEIRYQLWYDWVRDNLGLDATVTSLAARAAADLSAQGGTFADAADAARNAWRDAKRRANEAPLVDEAAGRSGNAAADRGQSGIPARRWGHRAVLAFPAVLEAVALIGLLFGGYVDESGNLPLISGVVLILGVPVAFVLIGGILLSTGNNRYAAVAAALAPASVLLNGFIALQLCEAAVRGINYAAPP